MTGRSNCSSLRPLGKGVRYAVYYIKIPLATVLSRVGMAQSSLRLAHRVFVYGSLKRGEPNYYRFQDESNGRAAFLGEAKLCDRYPLVVATKYNIPMILDTPGTGKVRHVTRVLIFLWKLCAPEPVSLSEASG